MSYFSRLTDIVTCNLSEILADASDPEAALDEIIDEMEEGRSGARRAVATAEASVGRLQGELDEQDAQIAAWAQRAREHVAAAREDEARAALVRRQEAQDVLAGLQQQHQAALATRDHLTTTLRALEARLHDARRKQQQLGSDDAAEFTTDSASSTASDGLEPADADRSARIEEQLAALKREVAGSGDERDKTSRTP